MGHSSSPAAHNDFITKWNDGLSIWPELELGRCGSRHTPW